VSTNQVASFQLFIDVDRPADYGTGCMQLLQVRRLFPSHATSLYVEPLLSCIEGMEGTSHGDAPEVDWTIDTPDDDVTQSA